MTASVHRRKGGGRGRGRSRLAPPPLNPPLLATNLCGEIYARAYNCETHLAVVECVLDTSKVPFIVGYLTTA